MADLSEPGRYPDPTGLRLAGLAIATTMLALSFDLAASFRSGGAMAALLCLGLALAAWRTPRRDMRRTELWSLVTGTPAAALVEGLPEAARPGAAGRGDAPAIALARRPNRDHRARPVAAGELLSLLG